MKRKKQGGGSDGVVQGQGQAFLTRRNMKSKGKQTSKADVYRYCGKHAHWIFKCSVKIRESSLQQRMQRANIAESNGNCGDYLYSVGGDTGAGKSSEMWLVDMGATQRMTYSKEYIENFKEISPMDVHLEDDGVVQALGTGNIVMLMKTAHGSIKV